MFLQIDGNAGLTGVGQRENPSCTSAPKHRDPYAKMHPTAFVVRTLSPTQAQAERIATWFKNLKDESNVSLWVSTNGGDGDDNTLLEALRVAGFQRVDVHKYTEDDMKETYPALRDKEFLAWQFHVQAVDLWWQAQAKPRPDHVWIIEDDVGYTGDISDLIGSVANASDDFLTSPQDKNETYLLKLGALTWHADCQTSAYQHRVGTERRAAREHVQRFSKALLHKLHEWSLRGELDTSEAMTGTVAMVEHLKVGWLPEGSIGQPFSCCEGQVAPDTWEEHLQACEGKLFHSLKF